MRRLMKEAMIYWKRYERIEKEQRKKAEKEALEQRKLDDEMREVGVLMYLLCPFTGFHLPWPLG